MNEIFKSACGFNVPARSARYGNRVHMVSAAISAITAERHLRRGRCRVGW